MLTTPAPVTVEITAFGVDDADGKPLAIGETYETDRATARALVDSGHAVLADAGDAGRVEKAPTGQTVEQSDTVAGEPFDPSAHTVDEVLVHIAQAAPEEVARVMEAEAAGQARKGVLSA